MANTREFFYSINHILPTKPNLLQFSYIILYHVATRNPIQDRMPLLSYALSNTVVSRVCCGPNSSYSCFFFLLPSNRMNHQSDPNSRLRPAWASIFEILKSIKCLWCFVFEILTCDFFSGIVRLFFLVFRAYFRVFVWFYVNFKLPKFCRDCEVSS